MAYECMYALLEKNCYGKVNFGQFTKTVMEGLKDQNEIKLLSYLLIIKISILSPASVSAHINEISDSFRVVLETKLKENSVKQELETHEELVRGVLRTIYVLQSEVVGSALANYPKFSSLLSDHIQSDNSKFQEEFDRQSQQIEHSISFAKRKN